MGDFKQGKDTIQLDHCVKEQNTDYFGAEWEGEWGVGQREETVRGLGCSQVRE